MKIIPLFLVLGFISCSTQPGMVFDLWYNYDYPLYNSLYDYTFYAFRIPVNYEGQMDFEVKIYKKDYQAFTICVNQWTYKPEINEIIYYQDTCSPVSGSGSYTEGDYVVYSYAFKAGPGAAYFSIDMVIPDYSAFKYIVVRVNSAKYRYSKIKELTYNTPYIIDTSIFTSTYNRIPYLYQIYIRISVFDNDKMEIQLKTHASYNPKVAFKVDVCQYVDVPTEQQVYYGNNAAKTNAEIENTSQEPELYKYPFTTDPGIKYLSISIINRLDNLDYLEIYIYSETGMAVALLVTIIVVPIIVVAAIIYAILRKCGYCNNN